MNLNRQTPDVDHEALIGQPTLMPLALSGVDLTAQSVCRFSRDVGQRHEA